MEHDGAEGGAAHARVGDTHHVAQALLRQLLRDRDIAGFGHARCATRAELTAEYRASLSRLIELEQAHEAELRDLRGPAAYSEKLGRRQRALAAVQQGLIRREMFSAV